ncbi:class IIb bacteriocin, lactobin A/cerein 7B family [Vibrio parahaemolyticus]|nr:MULTISPECIES: class IIb bacteriocin, lactobin A/cerein 7B family [Vibrio]EJG1161152.1 class IIb bacteriocin, lactobin A/cerein 7B family [Vibrio parahaemolyticus]EJL8301091.1 class IIb bacteriocin, lactobin A/cerein 7B family [Vibrio parahaemolyticus]MBE4100880.1 class IIb bacteriocin, lactobin A/cerein 7B family [Vibrio parahaemolyticus]PWY35698.1 class IIb bacteriocin, lactobin A/cerein 7B family [Vibrio vulnificus]HAS6586989.1 class IIb bacteriocin, lactobin A/cerein 7B family [Vibrio pa
MKELTSNEISQVNGGLAPIVVYGASFVAGAGVAWAIDNFVMWSMK